MSEEKIQAKLGVFDLSMIVVSLVIGVGIFRTPSIVAAAAGTPLIFFSAWILGGLVSFCGALTYAEIGSRYSVPGGFYKIFSYCYHPVYAFMINWMLVLTYGAGAAGVALIGADYITPVLFPGVSHPETYSLWIALVVIIFLAILNFLGIKTGARTQNFLSLVKIIMIVLLALSVFAVKSDSNFTAGVATEGSWWKALGVSLIAVFYTYGGYQQTMNFGGDVRSPRRNIPLAIGIGIVIIVSLYLCINYAYFQVLGFDKLKNTDLVASLLAEAFFGPAGFKIVSITIFLSVLGFVNVNMLSNPRIYYAMSQEGVLPAFFKKVNQRTQVQEVALGFFVGIVILSLFMLGTFEKIVNYVMVIDGVALASAAATVFILRAREDKANPHRGYKVWGYPLVPAIFVLFLFGVTVNVFITDFTSASIGLGFFIAGYPIYHLIKRNKRDINST